MPRFAEGFAKAQPAAGEAVEYGPTRVEGRATGIALYFSAEKPGAMGLKID